MVNYNYICFSCLYGRYSGPNISRAMTISPFLNLEIDSYSFFFGFTLICPGLSFIDPSASSCQLFARLLLLVSKEIIAAPNTKEAMRLPAHSRRIGFGLLTFCRPIPRKKVHIERKILPQRSDEERMSISRRGTITKICVPDTTSTGIENSSFDIPFPSCLHWCLTCLDYCFCLFSTNHTTVD